MLGHYLEEMSAQRIRKHWRHLIGRYGAYPVVWCAAGEATMPFYTYSGDRQAYVERVRHEWTEIVRCIRATDAFGRLVSIHPYKQRAPRGRRRFASRLRYAADRTFGPSRRPRHDVYTRASAEARTEDARDQ